MNRSWAPRGAALAVAAGLLGLYLLTMSGHTYSPDEETLLATAESVGLHGTFALPASRSLVEVPGLHGQIYSQYGPGQPVAAVPAERGDRDAGVHQVAQDLGDEGAGDVHLRRDLAQLLRPAGRVGPGQADGRARRVPAPLGERHIHAASVVSSFIITYR